MPKLLISGTFPTAEQVPSAMRDRIIRLGSLWANEKTRPIVKSEILEHWHKLILDWASNVSFSLFTFANGIRLLFEGRR